MGVSETPKCTSCGGVFHPATGSQPGPKVRVCGPCVRRFMDFMKGHTARRYRVGPKGKGAKYIAFPY